MLPLIPGIATVLLVDDEEPVREVARRMLQLFAERVISVASGQQALDLLAAGGLDRLELVVVDYTMPDIDGIELLRKLRIRLPQLPAILISGHDIEAVLASIDNCILLPKPFMLRGLRDAIDALSRRGPAKQANRLLSS